MSGAGGTATLAEMEIVAKMLETWAPSLRSLTLREQKPESRSYLPAVGKRSNLAYLRRLHVTDLTLQCGRPLDVLLAEFHFPALQIVQLDTTDIVHPNRIVFDMLDQLPVLQRLVLGVRQCQIQEKRSIGGTPYNDLEVACAERKFSYKRSTGRSFANKQRISRLRSAAFRFFRAL